jgi:triphosphoribosyl-dephospho-CoA synthase
MIKMNSEEITKIVQIACVLEVSGYPKPGNVHRTHNFDDMVFEDFLISGIVIGNIIQKATEDFGSKIKNNAKIPFPKANMGKYILENVRETNKWVLNNTNLGIIMLLTPIAISSRISKNFSELRENIHKLLINSTVDDAINLYSAINLADAGGMGKQTEFDVNSENAIDDLKTNNQTMYDVLKISADWDNLANELSSKMPITFEIGFPTFNTLKKKYSLNTATVITFLTILSKKPDTLISRKYGIEKSEKISKLAKQLLEKWYNDNKKIYTKDIKKNNKINDYDKYKHSWSEEFYNELIKFDKYLYENDFNPGTTADLTASSIMVSYLYDSKL